VDQDVISYISVGSQSEVVLCFVSFRLPIRTPVSGCVLADGYLANLQRFEA